MKTIVKLFFFAAVFYSANASAQNFQSLDTVKAPSDYENIYARKLYSDSLVTSFVIYVKNEVKAHKHITHSETVYVLEGNGEMMVGDKKFNVKRGDVVFIPKGTVHSLKVMSKTPVKVISVQSPMFDGKDRVMVE